MKGPLFQLLASGITLGIMAGAVTIHSLHLSGAKSLGAEEGITQVGAKSLPGPVMVGLDAAPVSLGARASEDAIEDRLVAIALEKVVARLDEMNEENRNLRREFSETFT